MDCPSQYLSDLITLKTIRHCSRGHNTTTPIAVVGGDFNATWSDNHGPLKSLGGWASAASLLSPVAQASLDGPDPLYSFYQGTTPKSLIDHLLLPGTHRVRWGGLWLLLRISLRPPPGAAWTPSTQPPTLAEFGGAHPGPPPPGSRSRSITTGTGKRLSPPHRGSPPHQLHPQSTRGSLRHTPEVLHGLGLLGSGTSHPPLPALLTFPLWARQPRGPFKQSRHLGMCG